MLSSVVSAHDLIFTCIAVMHVSAAQVTPGDVSKYLSDVGHCYSKHLVYVVDHIYSMS